ncbi:MAG: ACT domain-containing protein, partial [Geodermatophilaceae bacterium]|nr:ACT domain-containing protein [Geodermatophilaceae bacterium]
ATGRYLSLRMRVPDLPGSLARVLATVAELGANVIDVAHTRTTTQLALGFVDVALSLETRGAEHCGRVLDGLRALGYDPVQA